MRIVYEDLNIPNANEEQKKYKSKPTNARVYNFIRSLKNYNDIKVLESLIAKSIAEYGFLPKNNHFLDFVTEITWTVPDKCKNDFAILYSLQPDINIASNAPKSLIPDASGMNLCTFLTGAITNVYVDIFSRQKDDFIYTIKILSALLSPNVAKYFDSDVYKQITVDDIYLSNGLVKPAGVSDKENENTLYYQVEQWTNNNNKANKHKKIFTLSDLAEASKESGIYNQLIDLIKRIKLIPSVDRNAYINKLDKYNSYITSLPQAIGDFEATFKSHSGVDFDERLFSTYSYTKLNSTDIDTLKNIFGSDRTFKGK